MTFTNLVLVMIGVLIPVSPILFAGWIAWKENRPGGAHDYHVRRIKELRKELGKKPGCDPATLSWEEATKECIRLKHSVELKRASEDNERVYNKFRK